MQKVKHKNKFPAFTLFELVLVIAIAAIIFTVSASATVTYYRTSVVDSELRGMTANLRRARQTAIGNATSSDYSIKLLSDSYVLFPGTIYSPSSSNNEVYYLENSVILSSSFTNNIITFKSFTGRTDLAGTINLSGFDLTKQIYINSLGIVESIN